MSLPTTDPHGYFKLAIILCFLIAAVAFIGSTVILLKGLS